MPPTPPNHSARPPRGPRGRREREKARKLLEGPAEWTKNAPAAARATCYALLGDLDDCFRLLDRAVVDHLLLTHFWCNEPTLEHVRRDPRFAHLLKKMNLG